MALALYKTGRGKRGTFVTTFSEMTRDDIQQAGGNASNLGELTSAHLFL
jgi:hypothetical protein